LAQAVLAHAMWHEKYCLKAVSFFFLIPFVPGQLSSSAKHG